MKLICGISGTLLIVFARNAPLPDPGLPVALLCLGGTLCISACSLLINPLLEAIADESERRFLSNRHLSGHEQ